MTTHTPSGLLNRVYRMTDDLIALLRDVDKLDPDGEVGSAHHPEVKAIKRAILDLEGYVKHRLFKAIKEEEAVKAKAQIEKERQRIIDNGGSPSCGNGCEHGNGPKGEPHGS